MFVQLVQCSIKATLNISLIASAGYFLALRGYLSASLQKDLSKLSVLFFTPCLLFASTTLSSGFSNQVLMLIPIFLSLFFLVSWVFARFFCYIFAISHRHARFVTASLMFSNTNSLPIALIQALLSSVAFDYIRVRDDSPEDAIKRGIGYAAFFAILANLLRWSYGHHLLRADIEEDILMVEDENMNIGDFKGSHSLDEDEKTLFDDDDPLDSPSSFAVAHSSTVAHSSAVAQISMEEKSRKKKRPRRIPKCLANMVLLSRRLKHKYSTAAVGQFAARLFVSPPFIASVLGLLVLSCSCIKDLLAQPGSFLNATLMTAIKTCGEITVPLTLLCLGAQFAENSKAEKYNNVFLPDIYTFKRSKKLEKRVLIFVVTSRLFILPLLSFALVWMSMVLLTTFSPDSAAAAAATVSDPVFYLTMMILGACPTAVNLMIVCQAEGVFERLMGLNLFWQYVGSILTMTMWSVFAIWMASPPLY